MARRGRSAYTRLIESETEGTGLYYSSGNYEAFARPRRPEGVEHKTAYIVGSGLAGLTAACYLVRDGRMKGERIHIFEKEAAPGGALGSCERPGIGYLLPGPCAPDEHAEVMWDLLRSVPSLETDGTSVLDEVYRLNRRDPPRSFCRTTEKGGHDAAASGSGLSDEGAFKLARLFFTPDEELYDKRIADVLDGQALGSSFWLRWRTRLGLEDWHGALTLKYGLRRFVCGLDAAADGSGGRAACYDPYESLILPLVRYLEGHGVCFHYGTRVVSVGFDVREGKKTARRIELAVNGSAEAVDLTEDDLVFITLGGCAESACVGGQSEPGRFDARLRGGGGWDMWKRIAAQSPDFGRPEKFCADPGRTAGVSATVTTLDERIVPYIKAICKRDPFGGSAVTGGLVTARDSSWLMSWAFGRQPQLLRQPRGQLVGWLYGLRGERPGDWVKKPMRECTGRELCAEWLYHLGVPAGEIEELAAHGANTVPVMMPYRTAAYMPQAAHDRPDVVPEGAENFAFIGLFARTAQDSVLTAEYAMRTGMEAVYNLLGVERGVPAVWGGGYDLRTLLDAAVRLRDGRPIADIKKSWLERLALRAADGADIEGLLRACQTV